MTDNLKSARIDKFKPCDSSFVSNHLESYSFMSVDEDNDNYKALLSKQEDEIYYKRFFIRNFYSFADTLCIVFIFLLF